jgi:hypothetical protein
MTAAYSALEVLLTVLQVGPITVRAVRFRSGKHWLAAPFEEVKPNQQSRESNHQQIGMAIAFEFMVQRNELFKGERTMAQLMTSTTSPESRTLSRICFEMSLASRGLRSGW